MGAVTRSAIDTLAMSDGLSSGYGYRFGDAVALSDGFSSGSRELGILIEEALNFLDSAQGGVFYGATASDTLSLGDFVGLLRAFGLTDAISLSDAILNQDGQDRSDTFSFSDAVAFALGIPALLNLAVSVGDQFQFFDSLGFVTQGLGDFGDSFAFGDSVGVVLNSNQNDYLRRYLNDVRS